MRSVLNLPSVLLLALVGFPALIHAQDSSADYTEPFQVKALEMYRTMIGYRTAAGHGQVPALASYLADEFRKGGFPEGVLRRPRLLEAGRDEPGRGCPSLVE